MDMEIYEIKCSSTSVHREKHIVTSKVEKNKIKDTLERTTVTINHGKWREREIVCTWEKI